MSRYREPCRPSATTESALRWTPTCHLKTSPRGASDWAHWEALIRANGITVDRPLGAAHPRFPEIIYPMDYGYINGTMSTDDAEVDVFVGSAGNGLVALLVTSDFRKGDREVKLLYDCKPEETYLANGFINVDRTLMEDALTLRQPMSALR